MLVVVEVDVGVVVGTLKLELVSRRVDDTTAMNRHSPHVHAVWISLKSNKLLQC